MPEFSPLERCLEKADFAVERLRRGKHLLLPLSDKHNYLRVLEWIDPLIEGIAPAYSLHSLCQPKEKAYVQDIGEKIFGANILAERAYLARFLKNYYHSSPEGEFLFWEDLGKAETEIREELNRVVRRVVLEHKLGKDEYLVMFGTYFLHRAFKHEIIEPKGYFLRYNAPMEEKNASEQK